jgi:uncharacterized protein (DUF488 family)
VDASDLDPAADYIFTVGHSNTALGVLLDNLRAYGVEALVDVRSQPYSKYTPHFNRPELTSTLQEEGIRYAFMGDTLGGRPEGREFYDDEGYVRYDRWSESDRFREGIAKLKGSAARRRTAVLCSEEDPEACHRHLLIARVLASDGWPASRIAHIRGDGSCTLDEAIAVQQDLFGGEVAWRSPRSVLHKVQRSASSSGSAQPESDDW